MALEPYNDLKNIKFTKNGIKIDLHAKLKLGRSFLRLLQWCSVGKNKNEEDE